MMKVIRLFPLAWQRKMMVVVAFLSTGLAGSRFPKLRLAVDELNRQFPFDRTIALTETIPVLPPYPMVAKVRIEITVRTHVAIFITNDL